MSGCLRLENLLSILHDSVSRFLNRESYSPEDLFNEEKSTLSLAGGILSIDDSVLDKPYSPYAKTVNA